MVFTLNRQFVRSMIGSFYHKYKTEDKQNINDVFKIQNSYKTLRKCSLFHLN